ncbi:MAG: hypothetical protein IH600_15795 [Bacteroidetes bacterium]|nr:hypothetical protein [Bacteroidota bacterium]
MHPTGIEQSLPCILIIVVTLAVPCRSTSQNLSAIGETDPLHVGGSVSARAVIYSADEIRNRREPFSWVLNGTVNVNVYDVDLPFSFTYSEQERDFSQPFNQFGASPTWKWMRGHVGYRSITFSPYTLAGHQFLGGALEGNPGLFRFGLMYGRLQRAVQEDTAAGRFTLPAYERTGYAGRLGVGNSADYFDVIFLKAKDDASSLRQPPRTALVLPGENLVLGFTGSAEIVQGLRLSVDAAASDYSRDIRSQTVAGEENSHLAAFQGVSETRTSTQFYTAVKAGVAWTMQRFGITGTYNRIDPDYQSMGAYNMMNDLQSFALGPRLVLFDGAARVNATFTYRHDNLQNKKRATTRRFMPVVAIAILPAPQWGLDIQYTDVMTSQVDGYARLNDTTLLDQSNPMVSLMPRYSFTSGSASHSFLLGVMLQQLHDNNAFTSRYAEYNTTNFNLSYTLALSKLQFSLTAGGNTTRLENAGGVYRNSGLSLSATKSLFDQALRLNASSGYSFHNAGSTFTASAGAGYALQRRHSFSAQASFVRSTAGYYAKDSFSEITLVLGYAYTF